MNEEGPIYGVSLIDTLPIGNTGMLQQMATREDLERVKARAYTYRVAAAYEVLLWHYWRLIKANTGDCTDANRASQDRRHHIHDAE